MNKLGVESIISNICGKNKDMNSHLFSADMKLADVIHADYSLLLLLHRFGINLGFGDKTVRECCEANHVSCTLFLMICNVYSNEQYLPTEKEIEGIGANVDQLIAYLKNSHSYYLENRMLSIQEQLKEISEGCEQQHQQILNLFFNEYKNEVIRHFDYEEVTVFPYISNMVKGARPEDYEIGVFRENHSNIDDKLNDLKNIIMKYLPGDTVSDMRIRVLFGIFALEEDLSKHSLIEDKILVPLVMKLEQRYAKQ